ncbi:MULTISPECIES: hypothetical protein [Thermodesulfovibrio]|jgi:hypothetical protein|uniref:hypothetical protein n=1 Tax=Thermodesulfovibrio TaxID=28261 RepID=UPI0026195068|nr:hypothetical protein [Thermodesulfovibrio sp.]
METLAVKNQSNEVVCSFTFDEFDRLNELLTDVEAILGIFTALNPDDPDPLDNGYIVRLSIKGLDALTEAYNILNKK